MAAGKGKSDREISPSCQKAGSTHQLLECNCCHKYSSYWDAPYCLGTRVIENLIVCMWLHLHTHTHTHTRMFCCYCLGQSTVVAPHMVLHSLHQPSPCWLPKPLHLGGGGGGQTHYVHTTLPSLCTFVFIKFDTVQSTITASSDRD